eukprot:5658914-Karenia_brevis.AAC.1
MTNTGLLVAELPRCRTASGSAKDVKLADRIFSFVASKSDGCSGHVGQQLGNWQVFRKLSTVQ